MRIAHCILEPRYSGAEILVLNIIRTQIAHGIPSAVIALRPAEALFKQELVELEKIGCRVMVPTHRLNRRERIDWIRASHQQFCSQVIFAHSAIPSVYCRLAVWGKLDLVLVSVLHTDNDFADITLRIFEKLTWRRSAAVVAVSAAAVRNYCAKVTQAQDIRLIPNGINLQAVANVYAARERVRREVFSVASDEIVLLQVGRISPQKGQLLTVEALGALSQWISLEKIRLIFVGMVEFQDYYTRVVKSAKDSGVLERVEFLGSRNDIPSLLRGADAHLMPSGWEAHSIVAMEALASGIFCLFTAIESFLPFEQFEGVRMLPVDIDGVAFALSLKTAIESEALRHRYVRDVGRFDFEICAGEYMQLASSLLCAK